MTDPRHGPLTAFEEAQFRRDVDMAVGADFLPRGWQAIAVLLPRLLATLDAARAAAPPGENRVGVVFTAKVRAWNDDGSLVVQPGEDCHEYPAIGEGVTIGRNVGVRIRDLGPAMHPDGYPVDEMGG